MNKHRTAMRLAAVFFLLCGSGATLLAEQPTTRPAAAVPTTSPTETGLVALAQRKVREEYIRNLNIMLSPQIRERCGINKLTDTEKSELGLLLEVIAGDERLNMGARSRMRLQGYEPVIVEDDFLSGTQIIRKGYSRWVCKVQGLPSDGKYWCRFSAGKPVELVGWTGENHSVDLLRNLP
jgi:hypothetical protein